MGGGGGVQVRTVPLGEGGVEVRNVTLRTGTSTLYPPPPPPNPPQKQSLPSLRWCELITYRAIKTT
jgi:hypothetical protein